MRRQFFWILGNLSAFLSTSYALPSLLTEQDVHKGLLYIRPSSCAEALYPVILSNPEEVHYTRRPSRTPAPKSPPYAAQYSADAIWPHASDIVSGFSDIFSTAKQVVQSLFEEDETDDFLAFQRPLTLFYIDAEHAVHTRPVTRIQPDSQKHLTHIHAVDLHFEEPWHYHGFDASQRKIHWEGRGSEGIRTDFFVPFSSSIHLLQALVCGFQDFQTTAPLIFPFDSTFPRSYQPSHLSWRGATFPHVTQRMHLLMLEEKLYVTPLEVERKMAWLGSCPVRTLLPHEEVSRIPCSHTNSLNLRETANLLVGGSLSGFVPWALGFGGVPAVIGTAAAGALAINQRPHFIPPGTTLENQAQQIYLQEALKTWKKARRSLDLNANEIALQEIELSLSDEEEDRNLLLY